MKALQTVVKLTLSQHLHLPEASRPVFQFAPMTRRDRQQLAPLAEKVQAMGDGTDEALAAEVLDDAFAFVKSMLVGWANVVHPKTGKPAKYDPEELDAILTDGDALELALRLPIESQLEVADKKKSGSRSLDNSGRRASGARRRSATTRRPKRSR